MHTPSVSMIYDHTQAQKHTSKRGIKALPMNKKNQYILQILKDEL